MENKKKENEEYSDSDTEGPNKKDKTKLLFSSSQFDELLESEAAASHAESDDQQ